VSHTLQSLVDSYMATDLQIRSDLMYPSCVNNASLGQKVLARFPRFAGGGHLSTANARFAGRLCTKRPNIARAVHIPKAYALFVANRSWM
jgi:hypothetical protein